MKKRYLVFLLLFLSFPVLASDFSLYIIHPEGEGDTDSAKPYLATLFDYLKDKTKLEITGKYLNDTDDALEAFQNKKINSAIVSLSFFEKYHKKFNLEKVLQTIPIYSAGPYEKYYIMTQKNIDVMTLMDKQAKVNLFASKSYSNDFLNQKIFGNNEEIKKISWSLKESTNILNTIKKVVSGEPNAFILLSGYEFSVVNSLKKKNKDFRGLKLIYSSKQLPSSPFVSVGLSHKQEILKLKKALLTMSASLKGNLVLKKLRLRGFSGL